LRTGSRRAVEPEQLIQSIYIFDKKLD